MVRFSVEQQLFANAIRIFGKLSTVSDCLAELHRASKNVASVVANRTALLLMMITIISRLIIQQLPLKL